MIPVTETKRSYLKNIRLRQIQHQDQEIICTDILKLTEAAHRINIIQ
jgi:hypothetical protein